MQVVIPRPLVILQDAVPVNASQIGSLEARIDEGSGQICIWPPPASGYCVYEATNPRTCLGVYY